jgi:hypothetical protein
LIAGVVVALSVATVGRADTVTYSTPSGSLDTAGDPVSATATFTTGAGTVTIDLQNLQAGQKDAGQLVTDLFFTISTGQTAGTISSASSDSLFINSDKSVTPNGTVDPGWALTSDLGGLELDGLAGSATGPKQELVGPASADGKYDNANGSLAGNSAHNPFLDGVAHWVIDVTGVTAGSKISSATFSFGTTEGDNVGGSVPEPRGLVALMGLFGMGVIGTMWSRRNRVAS